MEGRLNTGRVIFDFKGKTVIVTGAARGIGRSMVKSFTDSGALVVAAEKTPRSYREPSSSPTTASSYITGAVINVDGGASVGTRPTNQVVDDDPRYFWVTDRE